LPDVPFPAKSFGTEESGALHWPQGYVSGDAGAETVNSSRQVSRLYVVAVVVVAGAAGGTVVEAMLGTADVSFSFDGEEAAFRFASRDTQTPTMTEQTMRMTSAIVI
jgi:hypothetical protein